MSFATWQPFCLGPNMTKNPFSKLLSRPMFAVSIVYDPVWWVCDPVVSHVIPHQYIHTTRVNTLHNYGIYIDISCLPFDRQITTDNHGISSLSWPFYVNYCKCFIMFFTHVFRVSQWPKLIISNEQIGLSTPSRICFWLNWGLVTFICVSDMGYHWFMQRFTACSRSPIHLNQWWRIQNWNNMRWNSQDVGHFIEDSICSRPQSIAISLHVWLQYGGVNTGSRHDREIFAALLA